MLRGAAAGGALLATYRKPRGTFAVGEPVSDEREEIADPTEDAHGWIDPVGRLTIERTA